MIIKVLNMEEHEPHDYESIDDWSLGEWSKVHTLGRGYSEEASSNYRQSRPFTLPRGVSMDSTDSMSATRDPASLQFPCSLPTDSSLPRYQAKVPYTIGTQCVSEPATPITGKNLDRSTILRSNALQELITPPRIDRSTKPPARPPKPTKEVIEPRKEPIAISKPYGLSDFCECEPMPKMVRVHAGYYGETERTSISEGEEFVFYLLKTVQAIPAKPMGSANSSEKFHIPINSMLKVAIIDKPSDSIRKYMYTSPRDLMTNRKECPRVVCVVKETLINSVLLPAGTLLFLDGKPTRKLIRCRTRKNTFCELPMDSACDLTTHPAETQIYIREYMLMVNKFPVDVQLFHGDGDDIYEEPSEVTSSIGMTLTLDAPVKQKSIIAKTDLEGTRKQNPITVEIPFDLPIEVEAIERPEENMEQIYSEVLELYQNFNPENIEKSYAVYDSSIEKVYHEYEKADIDYELECPNTDYEPLQEVLKKREQLLQQKQANANSTEGEIDKLKEENRKLLEEIEKLRQKKHDDYTKLVKSPNGDFDIYTPLGYSENLDELRKLSISGISQLLENMGLSRYVEQFKEQHVDGELMAALTEDSLSDLVQSSLHKKRLMLIATGQTSIRKYFDTENPYATTTVHKE